MDVHRDMEIPRFTRHELHVFFQQLDLDHDGRVGHRDLDLWMRCTGCVLMHGYASAAETMGREGAVAVQTLGGGGGGGGVSSSRNDWRRAGDNEGYVTPADAAALFHPAQPKFAKRRSLGTPEGREYQREQLARLERRQNGINNATEATSPEKQQSSSAPDSPPSPSESTDLVHDVLLPREVVSLKARFADALSAAREEVAVEAFKMRGKHGLSGGKQFRPPDGLDRKHFKQLVLQLFRESRDGGSEPSSGDLDRAFHLADEDSIGTVDEDGFVKLYASVKKGEVRGLGDMALFSSKGMMQSMMKSLQNAGTFIQLGASDDHAGGGHTARTSAQDQREAHYELIPDHLDGYRQALKADMDEYGKLSEAGLQLCLQRRPHLAAILRLVSQAWERLQAVNGGIDQLLNDAGMPVDSALAIEDLQAEVKKTFEESRENAATVAVLLRKESAARAAWLHAAVAAPAHARSSGTSDDGATSPSSLFRRTSSIAGKPMRALGGSTKQRSSGSLAMSFAVKVREMAEELLQAKKKLSSSQRRLKKLQSQLKDALHAARQHMRVIVHLETGLKLHLIAAEELEYFPTQIAIARQLGAHMKRPKSPKRLQEFNPATTPSKIAAQSFALHPALGSALGSKRAAEASNFPVSIDVSDSTTVASSNSRKVDFNASPANILNEAEEEERLKAEAEAAAVTAAAAAALAAAERAKNREAKAQMKADAKVKAKAKAKAAKVKAAEEDRLRAKAVAAAARAQAIEKARRESEAATNAKQNEAAAAESAKAKAEDGSRYE